MTGRRRGFPWAEALAALLVLLVALALLAADSIRYTIDTRQGRVVITALGHTIEGPKLPGRASLTLTLAPQERYSTGQTLVRDRGFLVNGFQFARFLVFGRREPFVRKPVVAGAVERFAQFNPFRAALLLNDANEEICRLEVNVPDAKIELWQRGAKLQDVPLHPPWLRLTLAPLGAAASTAALLAIVLGLLRAGSPAPAPPTAAAAWLTGRARRRAAITTAALFLAGVAATATIIVRVSHAIPGFGDEINYLVEGKIMASGRLAVPEPPMPEFFKVGWTDLWGADGKVWGFHPPGNSVLLALGWLVGLPWLTVPLVAGGILAVQHRLALEVLRSEPFALVHAAIVGTSHYVLSLASSYMAHAPSMLFVSLFFLSVVRFARRGSRRALLLAALWIGIAFVIRPLSAVLAAAVPLLVLALRARKATLGTYALAGLAGLAVSSTIFLYTWAITGRLALPYSVKGPEVGQTLTVRLAKPLQEHLGSLYRNCDELQHRVHSFGIIGNTTFFFLAVIVGLRRRAGGWLALASASFAFFILAHSFLHWYGWKWEPRMIYDVSFLFFLVTSAGVQAAVARRPRPTPVGLTIGAAVVGALLFAAAFDVPRRFATEYRGYNSAPAGAMAQLRSRGLREAVVLFGSEMAYASYLPFNAVTFDGPLVFAKSLGENYDYKLLTRFSSKPAYFSADGTSLAPRANFYHHDLATLDGDLPRLGGNDVTVVMPWLRMAPSDLNRRIRARVTDQGGFLASLAARKTAEASPRTVVFLGSATDLVPLVDIVAETRATTLSGYEGPIAVRTIGARRPREPSRFPGMWMTCYQGTTWSGAPVDRELVASLDLGPCSGENRSIVWDANFELQARRTFRFELESDDGSGLFIDGRAVIDDGLDATHGAERKAATVSLDPGVHAIQVRYFNGPDGEYLRLTAEDGRGGPVPVSVGTLVSGSPLFVDPLQTAPPGLRP